MILTTDYIKERHRYWRYRIFDEGIWDVVKFEPVEFEARPRSKTYNTLFHRKMIRRKPVDKIIIYRNFPDMSVKYVDSLIAHEMIHQYIIQNDLPDTSSHGRLFKEFMQRINEAFPQELKISIYGEAPILKGAGTKTHKLILLWMKDGECYCCKITPAKVPLFVKFIEKLST